MNMRYTVEEVSRVMSKLGMSFTVSAAKRLIDNGKLKKVPRPNSRYNTSYNYLVDVKSLEEYLINDVNLDRNNVLDAVYGTEGQ